MTEFVFISVVSAKLASFQGRARARDSEYVILVEENKRETFMQDYNVFNGIEDVSDLSKSSVMNKMETKQNNLSFDNDIQSKYRYWYGGLLESYSVTV